MIKIIYEDNHLLVVEKPVNMPVQSDASKDKDLFNSLKEYIKNKYNKPGNVYLGLLHRLDRPVGGIIVFAKTSKCASRISDQIRSHKFKKKYYAVVEGKINYKGEFIDKLLKDEKTNIVTVNDLGKESILNYELVEYKNNYSLVRINLVTGRSHQIRVQFSHHGYPLYGDQKYNKNSKVGQQIALFSNNVTFFHPITREKISLTTDLPDKYPWNMFENVN